MRPKPSMPVPNLVALSLKPKMLKSVNSADQLKALSPHSTEQIAVVQVAVARMGLSENQLCVFWRVGFTRSALFTALASTLVGFGMVSASAAQTATASADNKAVAPKVMAFDDITTDEELDRALEGLRLRRAVEKGQADSSAIDKYNEQLRQDELNKADKLSAKPSNSSFDDNNNDFNASNSLNNSDSMDANDGDTLTDAALQQQATMVQQQGYQMMTPEQIERELAALDIENLQQNNVADSSVGSNNSNSNNNNNSVNNRLNDAFDPIFDLDSNNELANSNGNFNDNANFNSNLNDGFNAPIAMLDSDRLPLGLDPKLDAAILPTPSNLDTLQGQQTAADRTETTEIMSRPIEVSDAVSSGRVDPSVDVTNQRNPAQTFAKQNNNAVTGAAAPTTEVQRQVSTGDISEVLNAQDEQTDVLDPDDYLPEYEAATDTQAISDSVAQSSKPKTSARNKGGIVKRLYNRFFNGGVAALPRVETTVYIQQAAANVATNSPASLSEADKDIQPINNIKAALDDTTVQSVVDFTAALPRLRQTALDAAKAVGYYDVALKLRQPSADTIDVIIERLGEPVKVDSRIVDIRGEGSTQDEFKTLEQNLPPDEGDIFNHRVYKNSKAALEALSSTYGYFDEYWLNKSVDVILPDNTADVTLVYDTGPRYQFDEVIFFTYDEATGTLTRDPAKLPVELSLLRQLYNFKEGDPFYRPAITKFSNDLSATRYFNTLNVESVLPPDSNSARSTLAFDNAPNKASVTNDGSDSDIDNDMIEGDTATDRALDTTNKTNSSDDKNIDGVDDSLSASGATVNDADIAPIEFEVDEQTQNKLQAIKQKADRLSSLPSDRLLDEKDEKAENFLGKISDSISNIAKKIFPEEKNTFDENFVPPTLANRITPEQVLANKKVPLYVFVSADKPRDAQVGIGYGTDTGVRVTGKIDYNLVNRQGYQAGAEVEASRVIKNLAVYGSRPWKHPLNDKLDARLSYEEKLLDRGEGNFDLTTNTLEAKLARNIRKENGWNRSYSIRYRLDELETSVEDSKLEDLPIEFTSSKPTQQALLLGYGMNKTSVNNVINPTKGYRQYYSAEVGAESALSDTDLAILRAGVSGIYSFGQDDKHQVLGSFNGGYILVDDFFEVPYNLRFLAGGDQSLRGYDFQSLSPKNDKGYLTGGQILAIGSAEYNYEFRPGFRGAIFSDVGNAYDKDFKNDTKVGVGVGIRWASPVGVVRVDVAAGVTEDEIPVRLHFFIGSPL